MLYVFLIQSKFLFIKFKDKKVETAVASLHRLKNQLNLANWFLPYCGQVVTRAEQV